MRSRINGASSRQHPIHFAERPSQKCSSSVAPLKLSHGQVLLDSELLNFAYLVRGTPDWPWHPRLPLARHPGLPLHAACLVAIQSNTLAPCLCLRLKQHWMQGSSKQAGTLQGLVWTSYHFVVLSTLSVCLWAVNHSLWLSVVAPHSCSATLPLALDISLQDKLQQTCPDVQPEDEQGW